MLWVSEHHSQRCYIWICKVGVEYCATKNFPFSALHCDPFVLLFLHTHTNPSSAYNQATKRTALHRQKRYLFVAGKETLNISGANVDREVVDGSGVIIN